MSAYGSVSVSGTAELIAHPPLCTFGSGKGDSFASMAEVQDVTRNVGAEPDKAVILVRNAAVNDENSPVVSLMREGPSGTKTLKMYSQVFISHGGSPLFVGSLVKRRDVGAQDSVILEYWDNRWLLAKIPVRACLVWDDVDKKVRFVTRYITRVNPNGYRNCVRIGADDWIFSALAEIGTAGQSPDDDEAADVPVGQACFWTPARLVKYWQKLATYKLSGTLLAYYSDFLALNENLLSWPRESCTFAGGGAGSTMNKKMPDTTFQGMPLLGALVKTLDIGGDYGLRVEHDYSKSTLKFYPRVNPAVRSEGSLDLQRGGYAGDARTAFDFVQETDASETYSGALTEGDVPHVESKWKFEGDIVNDTLLRAWTDVEEIIFMRIIDGDGTNAIGPVTYGDPPARWVPITTIKCRTQEAVNFARQILTKPFRCFRIESPGYDNAGQNSVRQRMYGFGDAFKYADRLKYSHPILPEQLTPYFETALEKRGRLRLPVRVMVSANDIDNPGGVGDYHDVTQNCGLRVTSDGLIWLEGLTDDQGQEGDRIYTGLLRNGTGAGKAVMCGVTINAAIPLDTRVKHALDIFGAGDSSVPDYNAIKEELAENMFMQYYSDSPDGFRAEHRMESAPAGGANLISDSLLYDSDRIATHTRRRIKDKARFQKTSSWRMIGIATGIRTGQYMGEINFQGAGSGFPVNSPIARVRLDFLQQETVVSPE